MIWMSAILLPEKWYLSDTSPGGTSSFIYMYVHIQAAMETQSCGVRCTEDTAGNFLILVVFARSSICEPRPFAVRAP